MHRHPRTLLAGGVLATALSLIATRSARRAVSAAAGSSNAELFAKPAYRCGATAGNCWGNRWKQSEIKCEFELQPRQVVRKIDDVEADGVWTELGKFGELPKELRDRQQAVSVPLPEGAYEVELQDGVKQTTTVDLHRTGLCVNGADIGQTEFLIKYNAPVMRFEGAGVKALFDSTQEKARPNDTRSDYFNWRTSTMCRHSAFCTQQHTEGKYETGGETFPFNPDAESQRQQRGRGGPVAGTGGDSASSSASSSSSAEEAREDEQEEGEEQQQNRDSATYSYEAFVKHSVRGHSRLEHKADSRGHGLYGPGGDAIHEQEDLAWDGVRRACELYNIKKVSADLKIPDAEKLIGPAHGEEEHADHEGVGAIKFRDDTPDRHGRIYYGHKFMTMSGETAPCSERGFLRSVLRKGGEKKEIKVVKKQWEQERRNSRQLRSPHISGTVRVEFEETVKELEPRAPEYLTLNEGSLNSTNDQNVRRRDLVFEIRIPRYLVRAYCMHKVLVGRGVSQPRGRQESYAGGIMGEVLSQVLWRVSGERVNRLMQVKREEEMLSRRHGQQARTAHAERSKAGSEQAAPCTGDGGEEHQPVVQGPRVHLLSPDSLPEIVARQGETVGELLLRRPDLVERNARIFVGGASATQRNSAMLPFQRLFHKTSSQQAEGGAAASEGYFCTLQTCVRDPTSRSGQASPPTSQIPLEIASARGDSYADRLRPAEELACALAGEAFLPNEVASRVIDLDVRNSALFDWQKLVDAGKEENGVPAACAVHKRWVDGGKNYSSKTEGTWTKPTGSGLSESFHFAPKDAGKLHGCRRTDDLLWIARPEQMKLVWDLMHKVTDQRPSTFGGVFGTAGIWKRIVHDHIWPQVKDGNWKTHFDGEVQEPYLEPWRKSNPSDKEAWLSTKYTGVKREIPMFASEKTIWSKAEFAALVEAVGKKVDEPLFELTNFVEPELIRRDYLQDETGWSPSAETRLRNARCRRAEQGRDGSDASGNDSSSEEDEEENEEDVRQGIATRHYRIEDLYRAIPRVGLNKRHKRRRFASTKRHLRRSDVEERWRTSYLTGEEEDAGAASGDSALEGKAEAVESTSSSTRTASTNSLLEVVGEEVSGPESEEAASYNGQETSLTTVEQDDTHPVGNMFSVQDLAEDAEIMFHFPDDRGTHEMVMLVIRQRLPPCGVSFL